jgi:DNA replication protein DnaC
MDTLPDRPPAQRLLPDRQPDREALCPEHGAYMSQNLLRNIWSKCPTCDAIEIERRRVADEKAAAEFAEQHHKQMIAESRVPARFVGRTFENFVASTDEQRAALTICRDFSENFAEYARKGASLILSGKPGTGKSHLTAAILQAHVMKAVRYTTCLDMIRAVRETWRRDSENSEAALLRYLEKLDLLAIDEVGMQYGTEGEQTILFDVLDRRYREVKPTILITNQDKEGFRQYVGDRTYDRLRETSRWVAFDWPSYRPVARKEMM